MSDHDDDVDNQSTRPRRRRRIENDQSSAYHNGAFQSQASSPSAAWRLDELTKAARSIMSEYIGAVRCVPPQIIVRCRGDSHAYSRAALKSCGYNTSVNRFTSRFAYPEDYSEASFLGFRYMASPDVRVYATFYPRCHHHYEPVAGMPVNGGLDERTREGAGHEADEVPPIRGTGLEGPVSIDREGWTELIDNIAFLDVLIMGRN